MYANWFGELQFANHIPSDPEIRILINALRNTTQELMIWLKDMRETCADSWSGLDCRICYFPTIVRIGYAETALHLVECQVFLETAYVRIHVS